MRDTSLPSPGILSNGFLLRREAAKAISAVQIAARNVPGGRVRSANKLQAFFTASAAALADLIDNVAPTVASRIRTAANTAVITFSEELDPASVPATSAFVFTPARTVTAVAVSGATVTITATGVLATDSVAYTAPGSNMLQDLIGNDIANFSGALSAPA